MASCERVPVYALCTPTHAVLRDEYFLPSLPANLEPRIREYCFEQPDGGEYKSQTFLRAVRLKVAMIQEAIRAHWGHPFVVSDVDVVFFRAFDPRALLGDDLDLVAQKNGHKLHNYCAGFYVCRANAATEELMGRLGKHRTGKSCLYVNRLDDIDLATLEELIRLSVAFMRKQYGC